MDKLTSRHLMFVIWGTGIVSIKTNVNIFIKDGGRDTWIAIIVSSMLILLYVLYTINTCARHNSFDFTEIYKQALGKYLGTIFLGFFIINLLLTLIEAASVEASAMHTNIMIETPPWYLILFFVIPAIYTVKNGIVPIITVAIIGVILAMLAGVNLVIMTAKYKDYRYLLPIFGQGITPGFSKAVLKSLGLYGSVAIMFPYFAYVMETNRLKKHIIIGILFILQMHIVSVTGAIASFGAERTQLLVYPKLVQTQMINYFGFLESGELFVMFQIIGGWFVKYILTFHAILKLLHDLKVKNRLIVFAISAFVLIASYFVGGNLFRLNTFLNFYCYSSLVNFVAVPAIIFTIFKFRKKHEILSNNNKSPEY